MCSKLVELVLKNFYLVNNIEQKCSTYFYVGRFPCPSEGFKSSPWGEGCLIWCVAFSPPGNRTATEECIVS